MDLPAVLKTKYAYHALLWLLQPEVVLDVGSMDGSGSRRFRKLLARADIVAFEGNPYNYRAMLEDRELGRSRIKVVNSLVSDSEGERSFFVQRPVAGAGHFNCGTSSLTRRDEDGGIAEEVLLDAVRIDSFLAREYPKSSSVALWIDVEGHAYSVLEGMSGAKDRVKLVHVEVETSEIWPDQKIEADVLRLAASMHLVPIARGAGTVRRDLILANRAWYRANRGGIHAMLRLAKLSGPALSRILGWSNFGRSSAQLWNDTIPQRGATAATAVTSVIVLSYNKFAETTGRCLDSLADDSQFPSWDVVVVDNASDQKTRSSLAAAAEKYPCLRLIFSETNQGFAGGMNLGMRQARGDVFILLNSDTIVPPGTIARIADTIRSRPEIGLLGPVSNAAGNEQGIFTRSARPQDAISEGIEFANAAHGRLSIPAYRLDFCCVALRRDAYETAGELDESFGRGYYEDFDYSLRVRNAGLDLAILEDAFIYHQGSASFKELGKETRNLIARNKALLLGKHGRGIRFPHSRDANLSVLNQYLRMSQAGQPPPQYRLLNRLALAKTNRPKSWWKRWRYDRRVAQVEQSLQNLDPGPARRQSL